MEKEQYSLSDLIVFFKGQKRSNFEIINIVLEVIDDTQLSLESKNRVIIDFLRQAGLTRQCEEEYLPEEVLLESQQVSVLLPVNEITTNILNGRVTYYIALN